MKQTSHDSDWLLTILNQTGLNLPDLRDEIQFLMWEDLFDNNHLTAEEVEKNVCNKLMKWSSIKVGSFGSITAAPASFPVIGSIGASVCTTTVDVAYLIRSQIELCYAISAVFDTDISEEKLKAITLALIDYDKNNDVLADIARTSFKSLINGLAAKYLKKGIERVAPDIAQKLMSRMLSRISAKWVPFMSIPVNAALNVSDIRKTGNRAISYFELKN